ncbi:Or45b [Drosophila busckii]|uniref:Odorant receptor n=1 Tax=Drosophila busckii TaxID=30019 RepID=A0A0M3QT12_DROBS|nr:Or24a [Drosophila busckii]ALC38159.1 Or45b [Drosophila busckii]
MWPRFLESSYPLDKNYFLLPKFGLSLIGFYPEQERSFKVRAWSFVNFFILTYGCYAEARYGIHFIPINIFTALDALCPVASSILSLLKMVCIWYYREEFDWLIKRVRVLNEQQCSANKQQYKRLCFTWATRLTWLLLWFGTWTSTAYTIRHMWDSLLRISNGQNWIYETPFKMMFPAPLLRLPIYPFIYALVHWHGYITVSCYVGGDGLFLGFCLYLSVLLRGIRVDVVELLSSQPVEQQATPEEEARVVRELERLIDRHNEVAELTERLSGVMVEITLGHFITSSLIIGTSIVDMLMFSGVGIIVYVVYTLAVLVEIFMYCIGGTFITEACMDLAVHAANSPWYAHSVRIQKMTLLLVARAQSVLVIKIPFFSPSLPTLTSVEFALNCLALFL